MIEPDVRNAIYQMHQQGMSLREISRCLRVSRNAVRKIVKQEGKPARRNRRDKKQIDPQLLERLYLECDGWMQRIREKLVEEHGIQIGYSTLTRMLREMELSRSQPVRCDRVPDEHRGRSSQPSAAPPAGLVRPTTTRPHPQFRLMLGNIPHSAQLRSFQILLRRAGNQFAPHHSNVRPAGLVRAETAGLRGGGTTQSREYFAIPLRCRHS